MNNQQKFVIANWKMYFSYNQAIAWCKNYKEELLHLTTKSSLIICPAYEAIPHIQALYHQTALSIGAQNCSEHTSGAYTGQVMVQSLKEIGVRYCIVAHSEVRKAFHDTNAIVQKKMQQLVEHAITPIFCVGETLQEYQHNETFDAVGQQLQPLHAVCKESSNKALTFLIAYEPIWAIGTGTVANNEHIGKVLNYIENAVTSFKKNHTFCLIYGGTVTSTTMVELNKITQLQGFLIGKASTDFQELKKIVSLL